MKIQLRVWNNGILENVEVIQPRGEKGLFKDMNGQIYVRTSDKTVWLARQDEQGKLYLVSDEGE